MTITLNKDEYLVSKNGYLRRIDNPSRKVKEKDVKPKSKPKKD